ncbi:MAG: class I SAM-dependent methyltransferase [Pseudomonadota bacterium]
MVHAEKNLAFRRDNLRAPTAKFYERGAESYYDKTIGANLGGLRERFQAHLVPGGCILDVGSGSGRDTKAFIEAGFRVDAFDQSVGLAKLSSKLTGQRTSVQRFEDWRSPGPIYDGIWAFASLLHVRRDDLSHVVSELARAMKPGAWFFASFKLGVGDTVDAQGRAFTNLTRPEAFDLFQNAGAFSTVDVWLDEAIASHGDKTTWVYILAQKSSS